ncbi:MAG: sugar ABC transporter substrate-binding protein, partial [Actinobacteria bacterium]|nr:sugar ABC transporter substrate-binding protein [Actinomycetota bacterium]
HGVQKYAEEDGWKVLIDPTQEGNLEDQLAVIESWESQGITAMNVFPAEPAAFEATAKRAVEEGIIWTTYINKMKEGAGGVLLPPQLSGKATGEAVVEWINKNDPEAEVLIQTASEQPELKDRSEIPKKMIEEETKATIVAEQDAVDPTTGLQVTEDVLQAHPNVSVVVGWNDEGALGAAKALQKQGTRKPNEVFVIGQDGALEALEAVTNPDSYFSETAAINGPEFYSEIVALNKRKIEEGWEEGDPQEWVEIGPIMISAEKNPQEAEKLLASYKQFE